MAIDSPTDFICVVRCGFAAGELLEGEARALDHHVVEHRLERRRRGLRDVVRDLVQPVARPRAWCRCARSGSPVALDASADERDTRGFISITSISPLAGLTANWMLQPPASTPISRMIAIAASRIFWYSRSVSVIAGATVIESPVCTPIGSTFSMRAHDHDVVGVVAHHLELVLLPPEHAALDQHLRGGRQIEPAAHDLLVLGAIVGDAAAGAAERERRPDDGREARPSAAARARRPTSARCRRWRPRGRSASSRRRTARDPRRGEWRARWRRSARRRTSRARRCRRAPARR